MMKRSSAGAGGVPFWYDQRHERTRATAERVLGIISDVSSFGSVADVGCGVGTWLRAAKDHGATNARGFEGSHLPRHLLEIDVSELSVVDLATPPAVTEKFDLVISLEVAEHVSASSTTAFVNFLCSLSDTVLFSAAIPGQGGNGHVNEQWQDYWTSEFGSRGYDCFDFLRPLLWSDESIPHWYRQNIFLFSRKADMGKRIGDAGYKCLPVSMQNLVHPQTFEPVVRRLAHPGIKRSLRSLRGAIEERLRRTPGASGERNGLQ